MRPACKNCTAYKPLETHISWEIPGYSVADFVQLLKSLGVERSLEDYLGLMFRHAKFSGVGIMVRGSKSVHKGVVRKLKVSSGSLGRTGKIVFFEEKTADELAEFMGYIYFLAREVLLGEGSISVDHLPVSKVGVYIIELRSRWSRVKERFEYWKVYSGKVCINKVCRDFNWFIPISTYSKKYYMVICHPEDLTRKLEDGRIDYPIANLMESYVWGGGRKTVSKVSESFATPVFTYKL